MALGASCIAIVGSTLPFTSAVWRPIEKGRYMAFLVSEQGHYRYGLNMAFRRISDKGTVPWYELKKGRPADFGTLSVKRVIERVEKVEKELKAKQPGLKKPGPKSQ